jgi:hypothetical protein
LHLNFYFFLSFNESLLSWNGYNTGSCPVILNNCKQGVLDPTLYPQVLWDLLGNGSLQENS